MSGHSKWHSIKHQKAANDAKRGKTFTKLANTISVAAKNGGGDPDMNIRLRMAMDAARAANMPKDNIERAVKRGTGELADKELHEFTIEAFGPGGVGIIVEVITDNRNRTLSDVRTIIEKAGGTVAGQGAVSHGFTQKGVLRGTVTTLTEEQEEKIIESGAEDYSVDDDQLTVYTERAKLKAVQDSLTPDFTFESAQLEFVPTTTVAIDAAAEERVLTLLTTLDDNDDVSAVYSNAAGL